MRPLHGRREAPQPNYYICQDQFLLHNLKVEILELQNRLASRSY
jgi:hypothetical protein